MDTPPIPNSLASALELRASEGLSFAETAASTGVAAGQLAAALYGLPVRPASPACTELVVTGPAEAALAEFVLRGRLRHELTVSGSMPPAQVTRLMAALPC